MTNKISPELRVLLERADERVISVQDRMRQVTEEYQRQMTLLEQESSTAQAIKSFVFYEVAGIYGLGEGDSILTNGTIQKSSNRVYMEPEVAQRVTTADSTEVIIHHDLPDTNDLTLPLENLAVGSSYYDHAVQAID